MGRKLITSCLLVFILMATGAWGGFEDIDTTRYYQNDWGVNVKVTNTGKEVMIIRDRTTHYSDDIQYAMQQWDQGDCMWDDSDPNTCPGVNIRMWEAGGPDATMEIVENYNPDGNSWAWVVDGKMVLNHGALEHYDEAFIRETILHEMGHALGFRHFPYQYTCKTLMVGCSTSLTAPTAIDRSMYLHRWVYGDWRKDGVIVNPEMS